MRSLIALALVAVGTNAASWERIGIVYSYSPPETFSFANPTEGFLSDPSQVYWTENGGKNWTIFPNFLPGQMDAIVALGNGVVVACGDGCQYSTDHGTTFHDSSSTGGDMNDCTVVEAWEDETVLTVCDGGIGRSTDKGQTFQFKLFPGFATPTSIAATPDPDTFYVGATNGTNNHQIGVYKTTNGGSSYSLMHLTPRTPFSDDAFPIDCASTTDCCFAGDFDFMGDTSALCTTDGGAHWTVVFANSDQQIDSDIKFVPGSTTELWGLGSYDTEDGLVGMSFHSLDGGKSWSTLNMTMFPAAGALLNVFSSSSVLAVGAASVGGELGVFSLQP